MAIKITTKRIGNRIIFDTKYHCLEFDSRLAEKKYPFAIGLYNEKINDKIITELESSKIVKVDTDLSYYSQKANISTLFIVPQPLFDFSKFTEVIFTLLQKLTDEIEST